MEINRDTVMKDYKSLVKYVVNSFRVNEFDKEELESECWLALSNSLNKFDESKNIKFITYVTAAMKKSCLSYLKCNKKHNYNYSLDKEDHYNYKENFADSIPNDEPTENEIINQMDLKNATRKVLSEYSPNKKYIIESYFMKDKKVQEITNEIKISQPTCNRIINKFKEDVKNELRLEEDEYIK